METLSNEIYNLLKINSPWIVSGLFIFFILKPLIPEIKDWIRSKIPGNVIKSKHEDQLNNINSGVMQIQKNHFHELKDELVRINDTLTRIENAQIRMNDNIIYIKSRINARE